MKLRLLPRIYLTLWGALAVAQPAVGVVSDIALYRLGEEDPGAVDGASGNDSTIDSVGALDLSRADAPTYSSDVPLPIASSLSMNFDGDGDRYAIGAVATTLTDNFGLEAWVRSDGAAANGVIGYNGDTSFGGWGLFYDMSGLYRVLFGGVTFFGSAPATTDWTHLAVVRDSGIATFYVNGVPQGTTGDAPNAPTAVPSGGVMIGGNLTGGEFFDGRVDEVRIFSFDPGEFSVTDLNLSFPAPTPAVPALNPWGFGIAFGLLLLTGFMGLRRRVAQ
jgi:hypothetical protein